MLPEPYPKMMDGKTARRRSPHLTILLCTDQYHISHAHYSDVIMSPMASQITSLAIVYSTVYKFRRRSKKTSKLRVTGLCVGNSPVTGEFPAQMASNAEKVSIWWRHHGIPFKWIIYRHWHRLGFVLVAMISTVCCRSYRHFNEESYVRDLQSAPFMICDIVDDLRVFQNSKNFSCIRAGLLLTYYACQTNSCDVSNFSKISAGLANEFLLACIKGE